MRLIAALATAGLYPSVPDLIVVRAVIMSVANLFTQSTLTPVKSCISKRRDDASLAALTDQEVDKFYVHVRLGGRADTL